MSVQQQQIRECEAAAKLTGVLVAVCGVDKSLVMFRIQPKVYFSSEIIHRNGDIGFPKFAQCAPSGDRCRAAAGQFMAPSNQAPPPGRGGRNWREQGPDCLLVRCALHGG